jgi:ribonucleoside-triphosphate reductase (formate)
MAIKTIIKKIRKRSGRVVAFSPGKIEKAIWAAFKAGERADKGKVREVTQEVVAELEKRFNGMLIPEVEQVQDIIEKTLLKRGHEAVYKAFKLYRELHRKLRKVDSLVDSDELIEKYLEKNDWRVKENANMTYSLQGLNNHVASIISSNFWLNRIYPKLIRKAHIQGDLHIHDLALLSPYCTGWDLKDFLLRGFGGVSGKVNSKPPKHLGAALGQLVNFFYTIQGEVAGAVAVSNFDTCMAPFVRYDNLSYKELKQLMQEFVFNMNVPTRVGFQTPFTNVTMDLKPTKTVAKESVVVGGKILKETYGEFQKEIDMFNRAFAEVMMEGDAQGRIFTFPIPTYSITKDFDWNNKTLEPIWEMTRKYGVPYFSNYVNSDMDPDDARSMCCRLRLDNRVLRRRGGLFAANPLTGSVGVVTINLPRLGYLARTESKPGHVKRKFFSLLGEQMDLAKESLIIKRDKVEDFTEKGLYPYCRYYLSDIYERNKVYWRNHFNTIGLNGMNEALVNMLGKNIVDEEGKALALEILGYMREKIMIYQKETGEMFNLEATPAEGTSYRFARIDKQKYQDMICANEEDYKKKGVAPYYTNSTHLPVGQTEDIFEAFDHQDELQCAYTGGTVLHGFLGESLSDTKSVKNLVRKLSANYKMPYFSLTPTFSVCPEHGYLKGEEKFCPKCKKEGKKTECEIFSRIVGYLRPVSQWNDGKVQEYKNRKEYKVKVT